MLSWWFVSLPDPNPGLALCLQVANDILMGWGLWPRWFGEPVYAPRSFGQRREQASNEGEPEHDEGDLAQSEDGAETTESEYMDDEDVSTDSEAEYKQIRCTGNVLQNEYWQLVRLGVIRALHSMRIPASGTLGAEEFQDVLHYLNCKGIEEVVLEQAVMKNAVRHAARTITESEVYTYASTNTASSTAGRPALPAEGS